MIRTDEIWFNIGRVLRAEGVFNHATSSFYKMGVLHDIILEETRREREYHTAQRDALLDGLFRLLDPVGFSEYLQRRQEREQGLDESQYEQVGEDHLPWDQLEQDLALINSGQALQEATPWEEELDNE